MRLIRVLGKYYLLNSEPELDEVDKLRETLFSKSSACCALVRLISFLQESCPSKLILCLDTLTKLRLPSC